MTQKTVFLPLMGGLDVTTPAISIPGGRAISSLNYEPDATGYRRLAGYERFDGRTSPTDAYNDAASGAEDAAMTAARAAITVVPGSGPVRGVWAYNGNVYAVRDNAGATAGVLHKATAGGWAAVTMSKQLSFTSGGTYEILEGNVVTGATSGATATVKRVVLTSGTWAAGTAAGYLAFETQTGTFVAENLNVGANLNVATIAGNSAAAALPAGGRYQFVNHNFYATAAGRRMYGVNGVGKAFEFDGTSFVFITTGTAVDTPSRIGVFRNHLMLGFPGGSVQNSGTGMPLSFLAIDGASEIGVGDEISDFLPAPNAFVILTASSIKILYGNDASDFQLESFTEEAGALPWTAVLMNGGLYMDNRGVRSLKAAQEYGNFQLGTLTQLVAPLIRDKIAGGILPVASTRVRTRDLYRVFFSDGSGLSVYTGRKQAETMAFDLGLEVKCICSFEDEDGHDERTYFGAANGYVYQMDKGRSFDSAVVRYYLRLPFNHMGGPFIRKRWHRAEVDCVSGAGATLAVSADVDYADQDEQGVPLQTFSVTGGGGFWDVSRWEQFYWNAAAAGKASAYLDAVGKNMSLLVAGEAADEDPHLLQGLTLFYSVRGLVR